MISRRQFTGLTLSLPLLATGLPALAHAQNAQVGRAAIGAKQDAFDATFGPGEEVGWFTVYDFSAQGKAAYWVAWDANGYAHRIANDYSAIPGGLPFAAGQLGQSQFLPNDASINAAGDISNMQVGDSGYYIAQHHSPGARANTGRSGNILVVDQRMIPGDGPNNPNFTRTSIAMEAYEVNPIVPTGELPTMESGPVWQTVFGDSWGTQRGTMPTNPPIAGEWMFYDQGVDVILDSAIPAVEAAQWVSDFLPLGMGEMSTTYWLPAPGDEVGLRVCLWTASTGMSRVALQVVHGGEENGWVDRWIINTIAPATV